MTGPPTRTTRQLLLRAPQPSDVDFLFAIQGNPVAMEFTYCSPSRKATAAYIESYSARFAGDGYAPWTAVFVPENRVVGWGGLNRDPKAPHWGTEVAYFFDPAYWGRGLATELVRACLSLAFSELGLSEVRAFVRPENHASVRVLCKAGFARVCFVPELERDKFQILVECWRGAAQQGAAPDAEQPA